MKAESNLNPYAAREGVWPDVSYGLAQQTVAYAPFGDGTDSVENVTYVKNRLFDRETAITVCAQKLNSCYATARANGDFSLLGGMLVYNHGSYPPIGDPYYTTYAANVEDYNNSINWAQSLNLGF